MFKQFLFKNVYAHKRLIHAENHMLVKTELCSVLKTKQDNIIILYNIITSYSYYIIYIIDLNCFCPNYIFLLNVCNNDK